jgi:hypothetical protein
MGIKSEFLGESVVNFFIVPFLEIVSIGAKRIFNAVSLAMQA